MPGPHKDFETIKHLDTDGNEYWEARELLLLLGYERWESAQEVVARAAAACMKSGQDVDNHFRQTTKMVKIGSNTVRMVVDYQLSRYACYLIAQNGDPSTKLQIALAQTYFANQTRKQETFDQLPENVQRLQIRDQVKEQGKQLNQTAAQAGVKKFGVFNDAGYRGLYGMPLSAIEQKKGIQKGELLDRAGSTELAANLFRITQTNEKLKKDKGQHSGDAAVSEVHRMVGDKVRQTIKEIGGVKPEELPTEKHIREVKRELRLTTGKGKKRRLKAAA